MINIEYHNMTRGHIYLLYTKMPEGKAMGFFTITDPQPVMDTFTIIHISQAFYIKDNKTVKVRLDYASTLSPASDSIFELTPDEFNTHIVIPQL